MGVRTVQTKTGPMGILAGGRDGEIALDGLHQRLDEYRAKAAATVLTLGAAAIMPRT